MKDGKDQDVLVHCLKCKDVKPSRLMKKVRNYWLCFYCDSVENGKPDGKWIGVLEKCEGRPRGFNVEGK